MALSLYDKTTVMINESLSIDDYSVLSLLYQPLIGIRGYSLYLTLYSFLSRVEFKADFIHADITDVLGMSINEFEEERKKLEAIGLLNSYQNESQYVYLLKAPLSARQFLKDGILGAFLQNKLGDELFLKVIKVFEIGKFNRDGYKNITEGFDDIFRTKINEANLKNSEYFMDKDKNGSVKFQKNFEWDFFKQSLPFGQEISKKIEEEIIKTAYYYNLNETEMQQVYYRAIVDGEVSIIKIAKEAKALYKYKSQPKKETGDEIEQMSPKEVLCSLVGKKRLIGQEIELLDRLTKETNFDNPTINVMLMYVFKAAGNTLPVYSYFEKVASTWKRNGVNSYEEAKKYVFSEFQVSTKKASKKENEPWLDDFLKNFKDSFKEKK